MARALTMTPRIAVLVVTASDSHRGGPMEGQVRLRRVYDDPSSDDGARVLVDRVWPRGLTKAAVHLDEWVKDIAPSTPLRRWYGHRPERFTEFRDRYLVELRDARPAAALDRFRELARTRTVTLLTATR